MQRIKYNRSMSASSHQDYWKSFTDVFATICLVFFFIMLVFGIMSSYLGNRARAFEEELIIAQNELFAEQLAFAIVIGELDERELELMEAQAALILAEMELEDIRTEFTRRITTQLAYMEIAREQFEYIALYEYHMYRQIEARLQEVLGDLVYFDEVSGTLVFDTNFLFAPGVWAVSPEHVETINLMAGVLFEIIREYATPDRLARFETFEFRGHADLLGTGESNRQLSQRRARSIVNLIVPSGTDYEIRYGRYFVASGASEFQPIAGTIFEQTPEEMALNRRVEIIVHFDTRDIQRAVMEIANALLMPDGDLLFDGQGEDGYEDNIIFMEEDLY